MASLQRRDLASGDTSWRVVWRSGGKLKVKTFDNESGAARWKAILEGAGEDAALRVLGVPDAATARTVAEQITHHIAHLTGIEEGTRRRYEAYLRNHIGPHLGTLPITALSRDDVAVWVNALATKRKPKTVRNVHSLLSESLAAAQREGIIGTNPAKGVRLPRIDREEMCFLTQEEFARLVEILPEQWRPLVMLLGGTGMRWGEASALQVRHVDLEARTIRIDQAWKETSGAGHRLGPPKSVRSRRAVALPAACRDDLARLMAGRGPDAFVFTNSRGGPVRHASFHDSVWLPAVHEFAGDVEMVDRSRRGRAKRSWVESGEGKRPRIHDLRHSFASWAIAAGHSLTAIQRHMGHESIKTTSDTYGHVVRADRDAFAELVPPSLPELAG